MSLFSGSHRICYLSWGLLISFSPADLSKDPPWKDLAFEGDSSGQEAFSRQVHWLSNAGLQVRLVAGVKVSLESFGQKSVLFHLQSLGERWVLKDWFGLRVLKARRGHRRVLNGLVWNQNVLKERERRDTVKKRRCSVEAELVWRSGRKRSKMMGEKGAKWWEEKEQMMGEKERWPPGQNWPNGVFIGTKASISAQTVTTVFSGKIDHWSL